jgi:hypothetical protein
VQGRRLLCGLLGGEAGPLMPAGMARVAGLVKVPQRLIEPIGRPVRHAREYSRRRHPQASVLAPHARWRRQAVS